MSTKIFALIYHKFQFCFELLIGLNKLKLIETHVHGWKLDVIHGKFTRFVDIIIQMKEMKLGQYFCHQFFFFVRVEMKMLKSNEQSTFLILLHLIAFGQL